MEAYITAGLPVFFYLLTVILVKCLQTVGGKGTRR